MLVSNTHLAQMRELCELSHPLETGGILIGHYNFELNAAVVTRVQGPPPDSQHGRSTFVRGSKGLSGLLRRLWPEGEYYLGEWHYHPSENAKPSARDIKQMQDIAENKESHCPEPVLLVLGTGNQLSVHVFPAGREMIPLQHHLQSVVPGEEP